MTDTGISRKNADTTRGRPFNQGNPGRPKGARNRVTVAVEALLEGEAEGLTRKAVELALGGDTVALRLCLDRIAPSRKDRPVILKLPLIGTAGDVVTALSATLAAMSRGDITPSEAATVAGVLEVKRRAIELLELEQRVTALEQQKTA
jgi:hypothetical protein